MNAELCGFVLLAVFIGHSTACQGQLTGKLASKATITYEVSPNVGWTWSTAGYSGQSQNAASAIAHARNDIDAAIRETMKQMNILPSLVKFNYNLDPQDVHIHAGTVCVEEGDHLLDADITVLYQCVASTAGRKRREVKLEQLAQVPGVDCTPVSDSTSTLGSTATSTAGTTPTTEMTPSTKVPTLPPCTTMAATTTTAGVTGSSTSAGTETTKTVTNTTTTTTTTVIPNAVNTTTTLPPTIFEKQLYKISGSANADSGLPLYEGQWNSIAQLIRAKLEAKGARFWTFTIVV